MQDNMQHTATIQIEEWPMETEKGTNIKKKLLKGKKLK